LDLVTKSSSTYVKLAFIYGVLERINRSVIIIAVKISQV